MPKLIQFLAVMSVMTLIGFNPALAQEEVVAPVFVELLLDKPSYEAGERAILSVYHSILPLDANTEVIALGSFDDEPINVTRIADRQSVSISPVLAAAAHNWEISVYLQDKQLAQALTSTIVFYEAEIVSLSSQRDAETDPDKRAILQGLVDRDQGFIDAAKGHLTSARRLVETKSVTVNAALSLRGVRIKDDTPALEVDTGSPACALYAVGTHVTFTVNVLESFMGSDGPKEAVVRGLFDAQVLGLTSSTAQQFVFNTPEFQLQDVGAHTFRARLFVRSQARADNLRDAISKAQIRRAQYIALRAGTVDASLQGYYTFCIGEMTSIINEFYRQLEAILVEVGTKDIQVNVTDTLVSVQQACNA